MHILFVFLDGVGLGADDEQENPLARLSLPAFERLAGGQRWTASAQRWLKPGHLFQAIDANLNVEGLPQSGTGQATLFTGINCAEVAGRHYGPFPHSRTRPILATENIFSKVQAVFTDEQEPAVFVNAYPDRFFAHVQKRDRWTVTTRCCLEAGLRIRTRDDLIAGSALPADLTGTTWPEPGVFLPLLSEMESGQRLVHIARQHRFTLFEYFLTDKAGHSQSTERCATVLHALDHFFTGILDVLDPSESLLLITSDHGNLENLSTKSHTRNPVPFIAYGHGADAFRAVRNLSDVAPAILEILRKNP